MKSTIKSAKEIIKTYDTTLGTPSSQKIIRTLTVWNQLPVKAIIEKTDLSESQVHLTLRNLESIKIIQQVHRGIYALEDTPFAVSLKNAYEKILIQIIGQKLHDLSNQLDSLSKTEQIAAMEDLTNQWKPLLTRYFKTKMSSLANRMIDAALVV